MRADLLFGTFFYLSHLKAKVAVSENSGCIQSGKISSARKQVSQSFCTYFRRRYSCLQMLIGTFSLKCLDG